MTKIEFAQTTSGLDWLSLLSVKYLRLYGSVLVHTSAERLDLTLEALTQPKLPIFLNPQRLQDGELSQTGSLIVTTDLTLDVKKYDWISECLITTETQAPPYFKRFKQLVMLFDNQPENIEISRSTFKTLRSEGYPLSYKELNRDTSLEYLNELANYG